MTFTEEQLREKLTEEQYHITQNKGTERYNWYIQTSINQYEIWLIGIVVYNVEPSLVVIGMSRMMERTHVLCVEKNCSSQFSYWLCTILVFFLHTEVTLNMILAQVASASLLHSACILLTKRLAIILWRCIKRKGKEDSRQITWYVKSWSCLCQCKWPDPVVDHLIHCLMLVWSSSGTCIWWWTSTN